MRPTIQTRLTAALLALAVLGFGHQHAPAVPSDPMLATYLQIGRSLDDLCMDLEDTPQGLALVCPVCTLAQSMALSPEAGQSGLSLRIARIEPPCAGHLLAGHPPARPRRVAPLSLLSEA
ncbi:MAG: hypothetical protein ACXIVG_14480 [Pararhodobacter sp.]